MSNVMCLSFVSILVLPLAFVEAENIVYPPDAGIYNVKSYGVFGDGTHDETQAIQALLDSKQNANAVIYFPNGTYLVSTTLKWGPSATTVNCGGCWKRTVFQGQSRDGVVIKLQNSAAGFSDTAAPKAVIWTGVAPAQRFRNGIRNLTVNTGTGNPGACGIQYNTSNQGSCEYIKIVSGDGAGVSGLDLRYTGEIGPGLIRHIAVDGFNYGINAECLNSMTLEDVALSNQRVCGLRNRNHDIAVRNLVSSNTVKAVENSGGSAYMVLLDATLSGGVAGPSISNSGVLYARNITRSGYAALIDNTAGANIDVADMHCAEFCSHPPTSLFDSPALTSMLNLPVKEAPEVAWDADMSQWVNPESTGAVGTDTQDDTKGLQAAIDAGKSTVYLPGGKTFYVNDTLYIRGTVSRIVGCEGRIQGTGTIVIQDGSAPVVAIERLDFIYSTVSIRNEASRSVALKGLTLGALISGTGTGDFFLDDVCNSHFEFTNPRQHIWIRQLNPEATNATNILNAGSTLWLMMLKTEGDETKLHTTLGGSTEVLGVHNYAASAGPKAGDSTAYFRVDDASFSVACYRETNFNNPSTAYTVYVRETRDGVTKFLNRAECTEAGAGGGKGIALFVGKKTDANARNPRASAGLPAMGIRLSCSGKDVSVRYTLRSPGTVKISVHDGAGKEVLRSPDEGQAAGERRFLLSTASLRSGVYFIRIFARDRSAALKFIVK